MRAILNVIWLVLCSLWLAILYAVAGALACVLIITIPFGIAAFRIANYVLWPFGRTIEPRRGAGAGALIGNIIWIILFGWWLAIGHLTTGGAALPDDHRHRQFQDHPHLAAAARHPHRAGAVTRATANRRPGA